MGVTPFSLTVLLLSTPRQALVRKYDDYKPIVHAKIVAALIGLI
jgi:hypothetical protein